MAGFLRFLALFVALVAFLVLVVLPLAASPILTQMVREMGLRSDSLNVSVALFDPTLLLGRSRRLHISATNVNLSPAAIGTLELTFGDVLLFDRSWRTVDGQITNISLTSGNETIGIGSVRVVGPANAANATARMTAAESEALIRFAAERVGLALDRVEVRNDGVRVTVDGVEAVARLEVRGGALVLFPGTGDGGVPLLQSAPSDAWQLEEAWISDDGLNVRGVVDTTRLAEQVTS
ncbi:MAG: hypothetical protein ACR2H0_09010 [Candidatus Limnocylindrales bacterium]